MKKEEIATDTLQLSAEDQKILQTAKKDPRKFKEPSKHPIPQTAPKTAELKSRGKSLPGSVVQSAVFSSTTGADFGGGETSQQPLFGNEDFNPSPQAIRPFGDVSSPTANNRKVASFAHFQKYLSHHLSTKKPLPTALKSPPPPTTPEALGRALISPKFRTVVNTSSAAAAAAAVREARDPEERDPESPENQTSSSPTSKAEAARQSLQDQQQLSNEEILVKLREAQEAHHSSYIHRQLLCQEYVRFVRQKRKERLEKRKAAAESNGRVSPQKSEPSAAAEEVTTTTTTTAEPKGPSTKKSSPSKRKAVAATHTQAKTKPNPKKKAVPTATDSPAATAAGQADSMAENTTDAATAVEGEERPRTAGEVLAHRAREARAALWAAEQDVVYWSNRIKMFKSQASKAFTKIQVAKKAAVVHEVSVDMNERTRQALERKQELIQVELQDRQVRMKKQNEIHQKLSSKGVAQMHAEKKDVREKLKLEEVNNSRIIGHQRFEEVQKKIQRMKLTQQQKMLSLVKRVNERAVKEEENHRRFEERIKLIEEKHHQKQQEVNQLIHEGAQVLDELRLLKAKQVAVESTIENPILRDRFAASI